MIMMIAETKNIRDRNLKHVREDQKETYLKTELTWVFSALDSKVAKLRHHLPHQNTDTHGRHQSCET